MRIVYRGNFKESKLLPFYQDDSSGRFSGIVSKDSVGIKMLN